MLQFILVATKLFSVRTGSILGAFADPTRRLLLEQLAAGPSSVKGISERLEVSISAVSQHLKVLREVGLVTSDSDGRHRIYRLTPDALESVRDEAARVLRPQSRQEHQSGVDPLQVLARQRARAWPQLDALNLLITFRIERLVHAIHKEMQSTAARAGLSLGEMLTLGAIGALGPPYESSPTELRRALWISLAGIGKRLDLLESRGLIQRLPNPDDRRGQVIRVTRRGLDALRATGLGMANRSYVALTHMPYDRRIELEQLLHQWQQTTDHST
jgi:DNA-binding MarR family transcriptional regulator